MISKILIISVILIILFLLTCGIGKFIEVGMSDRGEKMSDGGVDDDCV